MNTDTGCREAARDLLEYIDAGPSPWHAVAESARRLDAAGFTALDPRAAWELEAGRGYYVTRQETALAAFLVGAEPAEQRGFRIVGAHSDSPGLRIKPRGEQRAGGMIRLGVEVYGSPILATWADRDLSLAGRVPLRPPDAAEGENRLLAFIRPLVRIPSLAIHLDREVNVKGLKLNPQDGLPLLFAVEDQGETDANLLQELLARELEVPAESIRAFELCACDTQPGAFFGAGSEFMASGRLDNLASCHAALEALIAASRLPEPPGHHGVAVFFDHEEVGNQTPRGAGGSFLEDMLERIVLARGGGREALMRALAGSFLISADMAHAFNPGHQRAYDPQHHVLLNRGPVVKINANVRYTSDSPGTVRFERICEELDIPVQRYVHRSDLPCGTTIGPVAAARSGLSAVDVGNPLLSMHSIRESAGVLDHHRMIRVLERFFSAG